MKGILIVLAVLVASVVLVSCGNDNIKDVAYFDFNGADYWVYSYDNKVVTRADLNAQAKTLNNPYKTSYHFFFTDAKKAAKYGTDRFSSSSFASSIVASNPNYSCYIMTGDETINEDAMYLFE